jgi:hypothetical protein
MAYRTFHFETPTAAARFCEVEGLPYGEVRVVERNANGIATRCQISAPATLFGQVAA